MKNKEIEEALLILNNIECNRLSDTENEAIVIISNLIEKLESDKQKLIEKLEEDLVNISKKVNSEDYINNYRKIRLKAFKTKTREILKILKGVNNE